MFIMKRALVLLAAVLAVLSSQAQAQPRTAGTGAEGVSSCPSELPPVPELREVSNLDRWVESNEPLFTEASSFYLVAFAAPKDRTRIYVYGIDVASQRFLFAGTLSRELAGALTQRAGIDIGAFQTSGAADPRSAIMIQIEGPTPPPPPPNITDPRVENYAKLAWEVAVRTDLVAQQLREPRL
jgi:hypothetical protein